MNSKFYAGLALLVAGASAFGAVTAYSLMDRFNARKTKAEDSELATAKKEFTAEVRAMNVMLDRARDGVYADIPNKEATIREDFEFYKMIFMMED